MRKETSNWMDKHELDEDAAATRREDGGGGCFFRIWSTFLFRFTSTYRGVKREKIPIQVGQLGSGSFFFLIYVAIISE